MRLSRPLTALVAATAALTVLPPADARGAAPPVTSADIDGHLRALADIAGRNGGNRAAGLPGGQETVDYLTARLREAGWQVTTPSVRFPFSQDRTAPVLGAHQHGRDFVSVRGSGSGDVTGRPRAILAEKCAARSLRSLRRGEIAILPYLECTPQQATRLVRERGGVGIIYDGGPQPFPLRAAVGTPVSLPIVLARTRVAERIGRSRAPIRLKVDMLNERRTVTNVIAELKGSDRIVMAGGHLDSVLEGPGINDNGSGLAALLEIAERLPSEPRRATVRLGFWNAEEWGLYGSDAYVRGLARAERRRFAGYLNLDMVGSPNPLVEVYDTDNRLEALLRDQLPGREAEADLTGASDHDAFDTARIPIGGVYTGSFERHRGKPRDRCYHRACDGIDNVDRGMAARIATATQRALAVLARR